MLCLFQDAAAIYEPQQSAKHETDKREGYVISHTDFPEEYTPNIDSSLSIKGLEPLQLVWVRFIHFDLYLGCYNDYLEITGLQGDMKTFCLPEEPGLDEWLALTVSQTSLTFRFKTNSYGYSVKTGFLLQYSGELTPKC